MDEKHEARIGPRSFSSTKWLTMKTKELLELGVPLGRAQRLAIDFISKFILGGGDKTRLSDEIKAVVANPGSFLEDPLRAEFAKALIDSPPPLRLGLAPWKQWGKDLDAEAVAQISKACMLPVSVAGALMPDAHVGYGLPIGGVLATEGAVVPYAVGVDIACRMKLTVLDIPVTELERHRTASPRQLKPRRALASAHLSSIGAAHDVMDRDWSVSSVTATHKDRAHAQLGTSGSGNHFVEFGTFSVEDRSLGLEPGQYVALLSHSGSRGTGAAVCDHYSRVAVARHPELPQELKRLAWLSLDSAEGQEYWAAMELMGLYASANHGLIHKHIAANLGAQVLLDIENHHNFAWKERHFGRDVIVHRKGATPAGSGVLGIIPGSMASPGFVVRGKGNPDSLNSASHGAGRVMSRTQATRTFEWKNVKSYLKQQGVTLISAGLDEAPMVYKNIHEVMSAQSDLVDVAGAL